MVAHSMVEVLGFVSAPVFSGNTAAPVCHAWVVGVQMPGVAGLNSTEHDFPLGGRRSQHIEHLQRMDGWKPDGVRVMGVAMQGICVLGLPTLSVHGTHH